MSQDPILQAKFWRHFSRALGRPITPGCYAVADLPEWDSLRHVELVFELEESFGVSIPPDTIAALFSDTDTVLAYLHANTSS